MLTSVDPELVPVECMRWEGCSKVQQAAGVMPAQPDTKQKIVPILL